MIVLCDYCGDEAKLVGGLVIYPHRRDLRNAKFWYCEPCGAYVGTHANSKTHAPFGRLANAELRALKQQVHALFDPLWEGRETSRTDAYRWLADALAIPARECHIGMFDPERCRTAIDLLRARSGQTVTGNDHG